jgi:hypothetical protein
VSSDPVLDELHAFIERWPSMIGQDDDLIHSIWVDMMSHPIKCRVSAIRRLFAKVVRLESKVKRQERLIAEQRHVIILLWRMSPNDWRIVGEGRHKHINDGRGTSYLGVDTLEGKTIITGAREAAIVEDALKESKRDPFHV